MGGGREESTMLIDATQKEPDPPVSLPKREYMERALTIWRELGLPPVTPRQPWHGYSLGDWDAVGDTYASRAVIGKWEETGKETFARRRGGLTPETPVKSVKE
jgi:4-hydroxy-3-polyprenylbenzoate decarboxylase